MLVGGAYGRRRLAAVAAGVVLGAAMLMGCGTSAGGPVVLNFFTGTEGADQYRVAAARPGKGYLAALLPKGSAPLTDQAGAIALIILGWRPLSKDR